MSYFDTEEEFLSVYTACKLEEGGNPIINKQELDKVRSSFLKSPYCTNNIADELKKLNFNNLDLIIKRFQQKASKNRNKLKQCFVIKDENIFPTYEFFDFTKTTYSELFPFLLDEECSTISKEHIAPNLKNIDMSYLQVSKKVAGYITQSLAKNYIALELKKGKWPIHMQDTSNIFKKDLGLILELPGTKERFKRFNNYATYSICHLLTENKGTLILTNKISGNLAYNNMKRILNFDPFFENICNNFYDKQHNNFTITINVGIVNCKEKTLIDSDPYGNFSDTYKEEVRTL